MSRQHFVLLAMVQREEPQLLQVEHMQKQEMEKKLSFSPFTRVFKKGADCVFPCNL